MRRIFNPFFFCLLRILIAAECCAEEVAHRTKLMAAEFLILLKFAACCKFKIINKIVVATVISGVSCGLNFFIENIDSAKVNECL